MLNTINKYGVVFMDTIEKLFYALGISNLKLSPNAVKWV